MYKQPKSRDHNAKAPHGGEDETAIEAFRAYTGSGREGEDRKSFEEDYNESCEATGACDQPGGDGQDYARNKK